jgi:spermidine synthase
MAASGGKVCFEKSQFIVYEPYRGLHLAYHAKKFLFSRRSKFQQIDIIDNDAYGRMLFLDHNLQHTSYDAAIFNEALCGDAIRNRVQRLVVLGGGSGQTLLALLKSKALREVTLVEIDGLLIECCQRYIKGVRRAFKDPRVEVRIGDAFAYLHSTTERFDAAILDLTERPLRMGRDREALTRVYSDIKEKCHGRCSQYIGSSVGLAQSGQLRGLACTLSKEILSKVRFEDVFIPSFGAPHTFIHAGYPR